MKKKILLLIGVIGVLIPFGAKAAGPTVTIHCPKDTLNANEQVSCIIRGEYEGEKVFGVSGTIVLGDNLTKVRVSKHSIWEGTDDRLNIAYYLTDDETKEIDDVDYVYEGYSFSIASVTIRAQEVTEEVNTTVSISNLTLTKSDFTEESVTVEPANITIKPVSNSPITNDDTDDRSAEKDLLKFGLGKYDIGFNKNKVEYSLKVPNALKKLALCYGDYESDEILCMYSYENMISENADLAIYLNDKEFNDEDIEDMIRDCDAEAATCEIKKGDKIIGESKIVNNKLVGYVTIGDLKEGNNVLKLKVTAENETTKDYIFNINRLDKDGNDVSNPNTGIINYFGIFSLIIATGIGAFILIRKKSKFPKKA